MDNVIPLSRPGHRSSHSAGLRRANHYAGLQPKTSPVASFKVAAVVLPSRTGDLSLYVGASLPSSRHYGYRRQEPVSSSPQPPVP